MTNSDIVLQNFNGSPNLGAGYPNRFAGSQDAGAGSGIRQDPAEFNPCGQSTGFNANSVVCLLFTQSLGAHPLARRDFLVNWADTP